MANVLYAPHEGSSSCQFVSQCCSTLSPLSLLFGYPIISFELSRPLTVNFYRLFRPRLFFTGNAQVIEPGLFLNGNCCLVQDSLPIINTVICCCSSPHVQLRLAILYRIRELLTPVLVLGVLCERLKTIVFLMASELRGYGLVLHPLFHLF